MLSEYVGEPHEPGNPGFRPRGQYAEFATDEDGALWFGAQGWLNCIGHQCYVDLSKFTFSYADG